MKKVFILAVIVLAIENCPLVPGNQYTFEVWQDPQTGYIRTYTKIGSKEVTTDFANITDFFTYCNDITVVWPQPEPEV